MIGAFQTPDRRYLEFVDGSLMTDGFFSSVSSQFFGTVYGTGTDNIACLMINPSGNIERCTSANVLCEKKLIKDTLMCLDKTNLTGLMVYNALSEINVPLRLTASMCIEYCRGNESTYQASTLLLLFCMGNL
jgi:hypothetical protein